MRATNRMKKALILAFIVFLLVSHEYGLEIEMFLGTYLPYGTPRPTLMLLFVFGFIGLILGGQFLFDRLMQESKDRNKILVIKLRKSEFD